jgi:hypothetical protein
VCSVTPSCHLVSHGLSRRNALHHCRSTKATPRVQVGQTSSRNVTRTIDKPNPPDTIGNNTSPMPTPNTTTATPGNAAGAAPTIPCVKLTLGPPHTSTAHTNAQGDPTYVLYPCTIPDTDTARPGGRSNHGAVHSTSTNAGTDNLRLERAKANSSRKRKSTGNNSSSTDPTKKQKQSDAPATPTVTSRQGRSPDLGYVNFRMTKH